MQMNCLENLHICKASCCKIVYFRTPITDIGNNIVLNHLTLDKRRYYELHGIKIKRLQDRKYILNIPLQSEWKITGEGKNLLIGIPLTCKGLTKDNKCKYHNTENQPRICRILNEKTDKEKIIITNGCILKKIKEMI